MAAFLLGCRRHTALWLSPLTHSVGGRTIGQDTWNETTTAAVGGTQHGTAKVPSFRVPECY